MQATQKVISYQLTAKWETLCRKHATSLHVSNNNVRALENRSGYHGTSFRHLDLTEYNFVYMSALCSCLLFTKLRSDWTTAAGRNNRNGWSIFLRISSGNRQVLRWLSDDVGRKWKGAVYAFVQKRGDRYLEVDLRVARRRQRTVPTMLGIDIVGTNDPRFARLGFRSHRAPQLTFQR